MSLLFSPLNPSGNALSQLLRFVGKPNPSDIEANRSLSHLSKTQIQIAKESNRITQSKLALVKSPPSESPLATHHFNHQKTKELSRWENFSKHAWNESQTGESTTLKGIWNYLLGESKDPNFLSYHTRERKENLEMVVEPNEKGFTLYVFWKAEGFGPYGILFYYDPDLQTPVRIEFVTGGRDTNSWETDEVSLKQRLQELIRDFPQIGEFRFEEWKESSFNGDYR